MNHKECRNGLVACANKEKATLTCRYKGEILLCFGKNTKEIGFKNSSSLRKRKIHLKDHEVSGWSLFGLVVFFAGFIFCVVLVLIFFYYF